MVGRFEGMARFGSLGYQEDSFSAGKSVAAGAWRRSPPVVSFEPPSHLVATVCRNIRPLFNFAPPATPDEVRNASLQFVRKVSGFARPSKANQAAFDRAVGEITDTVRRLLDALVTTATPRDREVERARARARAAKRFAKQA